MGWWEQRVVPHLVNTMCGMKAVLPFRQRGLAGLSGTVLEIGFGSGLNLAAYPPEVTKVLAVEPSELARRMARERIARSGIEVEFIGLEGESIPLDDASVDAAASTFTLCTIPGVEQALAEVHRVLTPGGSFHFVEHGLHPEPNVQKWQHRIEPIQKRVAGGCHLTRDSASLVRAAGFTIEREEHDGMGGPKPFGYLTIATATART